MSDTPASAPPPWLRADGEDDDHLHGEPTEFDAPDVMPAPSRGWTPTHVPPPTAGLPPADRPVAGDVPSAPVGPDTPSGQQVSNPQGPHPSSADSGQVRPGYPPVPPPASHYPPQQPAVSPYPPQQPAVAPNPSPPAPYQPHSQFPPAPPGNPAGAFPQPAVQNLAPPPGLDPQRLVPGRQSRAPGTGWRRTLHTVSGGLITFGASKSQQQLDLMVQRVRQPVRGDFRLAVLSLKGGVGKTTTTLGLGSAFASLRGDRVIAVDANPDLGTLASRIPQQTPSTVRDLLSDENLRRYTDVRRHTSQATSRLEILASERDPAISEAFSADEYLRVLEILENHYNIIMTDCGTGLMHSAMEGVLSTANAIVVVTSPAVDGAQSASATLDWLNAHGHQRLVSQAVVVISASKPGGAPVDIEVLTEHFLGRCRAVQIVPYDHHLATGSYVDLDQMHRRTRTAFLELAATVADSFATTSMPQPPQHGAPATPNRAPDSDLRGE